MFFVVVPSLNDVFIFWIGVGFLLWLYTDAYAALSKERIARELAQSA